MSVTSMILGCCRHRNRRDSTEKRSLAFLEGQWDEEAAGLQQQATIQGQLAGRSLITGTSAGNLRIWNLEDGLEELKLEGHTDTITSMTVNWEAMVCLSGSGDRTVRLWDLKEGTCTLTLEGHEGWVWAVSMDYPSRRAFSLSDDRTLRLWNLKDGTCSEVINVDGGWAMCGTVDWVQGLALTGGSDSKLRLWDIKDGGERPMGEPFSGHTSSVRAVAADWSTAQQGSVGGAAPARCISGSSDGTLRLWEMTTGECVKVFEGHTASVRCVVADWEGLRAFSGSEDTSVRLWDLEEGTCLKTMESPGAEIRCVALDWACMASLSGCMGGETGVHLWGLTKGFRLATLDHYEGVMAIQAEGFVGTGM